MKLLIYFCLIFSILGVLGFGHETFVRKVLAQVGITSAKKIVVLDPGHCSNDKYGENKLPENALNIREANALAGLLNANGYDARIYNPSGVCTEADYYLNLQARVDFSNNNNAALYLSIHADAGVQNDSFNPIYSDTGPFPSESIRFAQSMAAEIKTQMATGGKQVDAYLSESTKTGTDQSEGLEYYVLGPVGSKTGGYYGGKVSSIIKQRNMPGIIMENYMKTKSDYTDIYPFVDIIALGYCNGVAKYLDNKSCDVSSATNSASATSSSSSSNSATDSWCTKVGDATGPNPCPSPEAKTTSGSLPPGSSATCPIPGGKIGCASYGPVESWGGFYGACAADSSGNGGHCNTIYQGQVGICRNREANGNLIRTAKSIDVSKPGGSVAGDPVYLPEIRGQKLKWFYKGTFSAGAGFGFMRLFQSEKTTEGIYTLHFVHVLQDNPSLKEDQELETGDVGAALYDLGDGYIHVHITVGLNIASLHADNFAQYDPGWLAADRDLSMCTGG